MTPSTRLLVGGGVLLVSAWLTTRADAGLARRAQDQSGRHLIRLGLVFLWALFALTLYEHIRPVPGVALQTPPRLDWSTGNVVIALAAVGLMHLWLSGKFPWQKIGP